MSHYAKAIVAVLGAVLTTVMVQFEGNPDVELWGPIVASFLTAVGVYLIPNTEPTGRHIDLDGDGHAG